MILKTINKHLKPINFVRIINNKIKKKFFLTVMEIKFL